MSSSSQALSLTWRLSQCRGHCIGGDTQRVAGRLRGKVFVQLWFAVRRWFRIVLEQRRFLAGLFNTLLRCCYSFSGRRRGVIGILTTELGNGQAIRGQIAQGKEDLPFTNDGIDKIGIAWNERCSWYFNAWEAGLTVELILNQIVEGFEKKEHQMVIIWCSEQKPRWGKCLCERKMWESLEDLFRGVPQVDEGVYCLKPSIRFSGRVRYWQWPLTDNHTTVANADVPKQ